MVSWVGPVILANERTEFEDGIWTRTTLRENIVWTLPEVNAIIDPGGSVARLFKK